MTTARETTGFRAGLRRLMPRLAIAAAILVVVRVALVSDAFAESHAVGRLLDGLARLTSFLTVVYFSPKVIRWLWRKILWRVRRRLVITYLFVGLTPIVLMGAMGLLASFVASAEIMAKAIRQELQSTEDQAAQSAAGLARELGSPAEGFVDAPLSTWLRERGTLLRATLPGARLAVWISRQEEGPAGSRSTAWIDLPADEDSRQLGPDATAPGDPLPAWLRQAAAFKGLIFMPPLDDPNAVFGAGSIRALARGGAAGRDIAVLVTVPVSRSLLVRLRQATRMEIHPYFDKDLIEFGEGNIKIQTSGPRSEQARDVARMEIRDPHGDVSPAGRDQLGDPLPRVPYPFMISATEWPTGESVNRLAFIFAWSWKEAARQVLGGMDVGGFWKAALLMAGAVFLCLELLALLAAVLITREVTGTVHELHLATAAVRRGDFSYRARKRSHDQLGELADAFNDMSDHIGTLLDERVERVRLQREVEIAAEVQSKLFPRSAPAMLTAEITGECRAARGVAGDYYDYITVAPGLLAIALADVSGKGISASLLMSNLQASLRAQAGVLKGVEPDGAAIPAGAALGPAANGAVARLASSLNAQLCRSTDINRYATLFLALYDEKARVLRYTNAGHNAAILVRADGTVTRLSHGGTIVGAFEGAVYEESFEGFSAGSVLLVFSDGISEAQNGEGAEFGEDRIAAFVVDNRHRSAEEIRRGLFVDVDAWSHGVERGDDQTVVIVKERGPAS